MRGPVSVTVYAPAKVNLTLHVTGQRADGYHLLDSLVAFADVGDTLVLQPAKTFSVAAEGPEAAGVPAGMDNLVLRVAALFPDVPAVHIRLIKNLPVSSGIGGGSADAAAAFRGMMTMRCHGEVSAELYDPARVSIIRDLLAEGADIPMCLMSQGTRVGGIGEEITPLPDLPPVAAVLVNPRRAVSTPSVFRAMHIRSNPPMPDVVPQFEDPTAFIRWLAGLRNDLEEAAIRLEPGIAAVKAALEREPACRLARMSGSGATCFGLFETGDAARSAADALKRDHPEWWIAPTELGSQTRRALPRVS